jgi:hypothetical protein
MKMITMNKVRSVWKQVALSLAAGVALTGSAQAGTWAQSAWTNDADSGITGVPADYTVAVNTGTAADAAVTVNGIDFQGHATSGTNFSMTGAFASTGRATNVTGASSTLASNFLYNGNPRTVTLSNLTVGESYETSFFAYGWDAQTPTPYIRNVTFASGSDSLLVDQNFYGQNNGIRVSYTFLATTTSRVLTLTPGPGGNGGSFHLSALSNRKVPTPPATITLFGDNVAGSSAVISPVVANAGTITWTVPFNSVLANLAPTFMLYSAAATCNQTSGAVPTPNFGSGPVPYTVTDGATVNTYTVTAVLGPPSTARDITSFNANYPGSSAVITNTGPGTGTVVVVLPYGTPAVIAGTLAPTFTLSAGATCNQVSGSKPTPNLSIGGSVTYTVTAEDGISTRDYAVTLLRSGWKYSPWTGDADSGIGGAPGDYTMAVNTGTGGDAAVTVNGIPFETHAVSGANFSIGGAIAATGRANNVTGDSGTLAFNFIYNASPRTITLTNLTVGTKYETSIFAYGWDASGRTQTFAAGVDRMVADQDAFGNNNGIRISYEFVASAASQALTITQAPGSVGTFHMSAVANRIAPQPVDTDNDLIPDEWEIAKAGNLTDLTGLLSGPGPGANTGDYDDDTLTDADEYALSSLYPNINPKLADTDGDGLDDGDEIIPTAPRVATNPTVADSDGDGLSDMVENNSGTFVNAGNPGTNPVSVDSDGDQFPDLYEINQGGNPTLGTSLPAVLPAGITLGVVTDEVSTGISATEIYTHKMSGGSATTVNGVALDVLDTVTTPANFAWSQNPAGKNIIGPGSNPGTWNAASGNVTGDGNLQMFGTFTYAGAGAAPGSTQQFALSALEPGMTYELRLFIRKWDDVTVRPQYLKFTNGAQVTDFYILEDRPGTMLGNGNDNSAYYISYTYVAQSDTMTVETTVSNVSSGDGSFHMYGLTNREASLPPPLDFASVVRAPDGASVTLNITSRPGRVYAVDFSTNHVSWIELTDSVPSTGLVTTYIDTIASNLPRALYRVRDVTP